MPSARVAAIAQSWLPIVSGLNPQTVYDTADRIEEPLPDGVLDFLVRSPGYNHALAGIPAPAARAALQHQFAQGRERHYKAWLQDLQHMQRRLTNERGLDFPAVASNVAILRDEGQATLDRCRGYLEAWLRPLAAKGGTVRVRAERQMTEAFHVGKMKKEWPAAAVLSDKAWARLFDHGNDYQAVIVEFIAAGAEFPIAGMGLNCSLGTRKTVIAADTDHDPETAEYNTQMLALTLRKMRGRKVHDVALGQTVHLYNWTINHLDGFRYLDTSADDMKLRLDRLAVERRPLQAWHGQATWIPVFDRAEAYESTV